MAAFAARMRDATARGLCVCAKVKCGHWPVHGSHPSLLVVGKLKYFFFAIHAYQGIPKEGFETV